MSAGMSAVLMRERPVYSIHREFAATLGVFYRYVRGLAVRFAKGDVDLANDFTQIAAIELWRLRADGRGESDDHLRSRLRMRLLNAWREERRQGMKIRWRPTRPLKTGLPQLPQLNREERNEARV